MNKLKHHLQLTIFTAIKINTAKLPSSHCLKPGATVV